MLLGAAACAAVAAGATLAGAPRYTTTALVEVGRVMGEQLENPYAVAQTINSPGFQAAMRAKSLGGALPGSVSAEAMTGGQGRLEHPTLVRLTAAGPSPDAAVAAGRAAVDELVARHGQRFEQAIAGYREHERVLAGAADPASRRDLYELRARLQSPIFTAETRAKDEIPVPSAPVPRNTLLSASVAFAVGLAILSLVVMAIAQVTPRRA